MFRQPQGWIYLGQAMVEGREMEIYRTRPYADDWRAVNDSDSDGDIEQSEVVVARPYKPSLSERFRNLLDSIRVPQVKSLRERQPIDD